MENVVVNKFAYKTAQQKQDILKSFYKDFSCNFGNGNSLSEEKVSLDMPLYIY